MSFDIYWTDYKGDYGVCNVATEKERDKVLKDMKSNRVFSSASYSRVFKSGEHSEQIHVFKR